MYKDLVSLVTPCYNTAHLLSNLLESVLRQTYSKIQMIIIDDGSSDNCKEIFEYYIPKFENRGYSLEYHYQLNQGQSVALKTGLSFVKGEFVAWPDSDDYYASRAAIAKMVESLKNAGAEYGMVRVGVKFIEEGSPAHTHEVGLSNHYSTSFEDCVFARNNFMYIPIAYMAKSAYLYERTHFDLYTAKDAGQNWQMYLPMLYRYKIKPIYEILAVGLERRDSHSRGLYRGFDKQCKKLEVYEATILTTLDCIRDMPKDLKQKIKSQVVNKYFNEILNLAWNHRKRDLYLSIYRRSINDVKLLKLGGGNLLILRAKCIFGILRTELMVESVLRILNLFKRQNEQATQ